MSAPGVTETQWIVLDAVRCKETRTIHGRAAWISDVVEIAAAQADMAHALAKRTIADMKRAGMIDSNDWRVWLTPKGRAFLEDGNTEGF